MLASIPSLPDVFGNYALGEFSEVVVPPAVSWLPRTAGWAWLAALCLLLIARWAIRCGKKWLSNRYRREARQRLAQMRTTYSGDDFLYELNRLLKLTAMAAFPREQVAQLSGKSWTTFLNTQCPDAPFTPQLNEWLANGPYSQTVPDADTCAALSTAALQWINLHRRPHND